MGSRSWLEDVLFAGLVIASFTALLVAFASPSAADGGRLRARPRSPDQQRQIQAAAMRVDGVLGGIQRAMGVDAAGRAELLSVARRASLALTGTIPSVEEIRQIEAQPPEQALSIWIDHLLADPRFADYFAERLARALVGVDGGPVVEYRRRRFVAWLSDRIADNRPWDRIVAQMVSGVGLWTQNPPVNFVTAALVKGTERPDEAVLTTRMSRALLGVRLDCAQCHDHPFDPRWKQADFHGLAAFFGRAKVTFGGVRDVDGAYEYDERATGQRVGIEPAVPFEPELLPEAGSDRWRLAAWLTHPDNRAFSRAIVNRVWALMLGRALIEPVDDLDVGSPILPVVDALADDFIEHRFDLHHLIRVIAATEAFGRASRGPTEHDDHARLQARLESWAELPLTRLRPEQVVGALLQSASITTVDHDSHVIVRLVRFLQQRDFVTRYGDAGELELEPADGTIPQRLLMLNGDIVHERTRDDLVGNAATRIAVLVADDAKAIEAAYLAVLTRRPSTAEHEYFAERLAGLEGDARTEAIADLYWALLNSTELSWNH